MGKKDKKKKGQETTKDWCAKACSIAGGFFCLVVLVPAVPWRYAQINVNLGARFTNDRFMSPFSVTNHMRVATPWIGLSQKMCDKMVEFQRNPAAAVGGLLMNMGATKLGAGDYTGGALVGCMGWDICNQHVASRCMIYSILAYSGLFCMFVQLCGAIAGFLVAVMMSNEKGAGKKKKKQMAAKSLTMKVSIGAFAGTWVGTYVWMAISHMQLSDLQSSAYYPWQGAFIGLYASLFGNLCCGVGMYHGITRIHPLFAKKEDSDDEDGEEQEEYAAAPSEAEALAAAPPPPPGM